MSTLQALLIYFECHLFSALGGSRSMTTDGSSGMNQSAYANLGEIHFFIQWINCQRCGSCVGSAVPPYHLQCDSTLHEPKPKKYHQNPCHLLAYIPNLHITNHTKFT
jgi:hypothetical protein